MLLSMLRPMEKFMINSVKVGQELGCRLADMGFTEGAEGFVIRCGGFGGPMHVRLNGYDLLIRREEAAKVEVKLLSEPKACCRHGRGHAHRGFRRVHNSYGHSYPRVADQG
ncbi:hypothetical protein MASR2M29_06500 [Spirochaetota bacterium]